MKVIKSIFHKWGDLTCYAQGNIYTGLSGIQNLQQNNAFYHNNKTEQEHICSNIKNKKNMKKKPQSF